MDISARSKWELVAALYQHGANIEALKKALPKWTEDQLKHVIHRFRTRAARQVNLKTKLGDPSAQEQPVDQWKRFIDICHDLGGFINKSKNRRGRLSFTAELKDHTFLLSKVMLYAACFENHYQGSGPDEPNYSEIYRYLSQLLAGEEPTQLRPASAAKVLQMLDRLEHILSEIPSADYTKHLNNRTLPYLEPDDVMKVKLEVPSTSEESQSAQGGAPTITLFEDVDEAEINELDPEDPYFEEKKERIILKLQAAQEELGLSVQNLPGFNPLLLPTEALNKAAVSSVLWNRGHSPRKTKRMRLNSSSKCGIDESSKGTSCNSSL